MTARVAYAGKDAQTNKWYLSVLGPRSKWKGPQRAANFYDTPQQLLEEAGRRGLTVEWENGKPD